MPSPQIALSSADSILLARWRVAIGEETPALSPFSVFGSSVAFIPSRIGTDPVLDSAVRYFVDSVDIVLRNRRIGGAPTSASGEQALRALRNAIAAGKIDGNILLAVKLHFVAELVVDIGRWSYVPHVFGLSQLLRQRVISGSAEELDRILAQAIYLEETTESLLSGKDSALDGFLPSQGHLNQCGQKTAINLAASALLHRTVKLPRLARLIRACFVEPESITLVGKATHLAEELYLNDAWPLIETVLTGIQVAPTKTAKFAHHFSQSYHNFPSIEAFTLSVRYHTFRVLLCGLLQKLLSLNARFARFDRKLIEQQDIESATAIGMSADFAFTVKQRIPLVILRMMIPLGFSFGAFHRLYTREPSKHALATLNWCIDILNDVSRLWRVPEYSITTMRLKVEAIAGGPIVSGVGRDFEWSS